MGNDFNIINQSVIDRKDDSVTDTRTLLVKNNYSSHEDIQFLARMNVYISCGEEELLRETVMN